MPALTSDRRDMEVSLPGPFRGIGHVLAVGRGKADTDAQIWQIRMRVVTAVKFGNRLGIALAGLRLHQHAFLKMRLENALQGDKEGGAIVAVPVCVASWYDLGIVNLHLDLGVSRQRAVKSIEKQIPMEAVAGRYDAVEFELEIPVIVQPSFHRYLPCQRTSA